MIGKINNGILRKVPSVWGLCTLALTISFMVCGMEDGGGRLRTSHTRMFASSEATRASGKSSSVATGRDLILVDDESSNPTISPSPTISAAPSPVPSHSRAPAYPTQAPTLDPTEPPTEPPTELPTQAPTDDPTAAPTMMPTSLTLSQKIQESFPRVAAWSLVITFTSISCIVWAVRNQPNNKDGRKLCVNIPQVFLKDPVPNEIAFRNSMPDVELVPASTWKTNEDWEGTRDGAADPLPPVSSFETSELSTEYSVMN